MAANEIKQIVPGAPTAMRTRREGGGTPVWTQWGADCEYGLLRDVLLGRPQYMQLLPTNSVSRLQLKSGVRFDAEVASAQHRELVAAFVTAGVRVHYLESDASLPYQVFARDSSVMTPYGAIVAQLSQWWRRGEHAPVTRFFLDNGIPIYDIVTAGGFEGGDFNVVRPKSLLLGYSEERTQFTGARQVQNGSVAIRKRLVCCAPV
jgi:N-dimethylarginine dimethylaminohydrolase